MRAEVGKPLAPLAKIDKLPLNGVDDAILSVVVLPETLRLKFVDNCLLVPINPTALVVPTCVDALVLFLKNIALDRPKLFVPAELVGASAPMYAEVAEPADVR